MSHFFPPETLSRELRNDTGPFYCYVLWISDTCQYYVGHTNDPDRRRDEHLSGTVGTTRGHSLERIWVSRKMGTREEAKGFEGALKNYIKSKKSNDFERCTDHLEFDYGATLLEW